MNGARLAEDLEKLNRRSVLTGLAGLVATRAALAKDAPSPVAHGVLAQNELAQGFELAPSHLPDVSILGPNGRRDIDTLFGRTLLMPLWAEWCAPCLKEISDFAWLQQKYGNTKFAIVPILSGPKKRISPANISQFFTILHATVFEPLMEDGWNDQLLERMARDGRELGPRLIKSTIR